MNGLSGIKEVTDTIWQKVLLNMKKILTLKQIKYQYKNGNKYI